MCPITEFAKPPAATLLGHVEELALSDATSTLGCRGGNPSAATAISALAGGEILMLPAPGPVYTTVDRCAVSSKTDRGVCARIAIKPTCIRFILVGPLPPASRVPPGGWLHSKPCNGKRPGACRNTKSMSGERTLYTCSEITKAHKTTINHTAPRWSRSSAVAVKKVSKNSKCAWDLFMLPFRSVSAAIYRSLPARMGTRYLQRHVTALSKCACEADTEITAP